MNRNWKQMTASLLVLVSLAGQSALAAGNKGFQGGQQQGNGQNQGAGKGAQVARPSFSVQPKVVSGNGGGSFKSLPGKVSAPQGTFKPVTTPFKPPKVLPVGGFPVNPLPPLGPIGPIKPPTVKPPTANPFPPLGPIGPIKPPKVNPFPPIGPIGPVKPPIVNPLPPIGPIGPIKPPVGPFPPIGPINPLPPIGPLPPFPPINPNPPMPPVCPPHHGHCHPHWGCWTGWVGGWINCPIVQPCSLPVVSVVEVVPVQTTVVVLETARREIDLAVKEVRVVEKANAERGPLYRVYITNKSLNDLDVPTRVALLGVNGEQPTDDTPRAIETLKSLRGGETVAMDIRLPATSASYPLLLAVVEVPETYTDTNEQDNVAQGEVARLPLVVATTK
ncbi:MAG: hypothetical protein AABP62_07125 [Planctomycetota bacterium]